MEIPPLDVKKKTLLRPSAVDKYSTVSERTDPPGSARLADNQFLNGNQRISPGDYLICRNLVKKSNWAVTFGVFGLISSYLVTT